MTVPTAPLLDGGRDLLLVGLTGSRAYGTHRPDSDYDYKGLYLAPTTSLIGMYPPKYEKMTAHEPKIEDDGTGREVGYTYHELAKGMHLMTQSNPDAIELLWLTDYDILDDRGKELLDMRDLFPTKSQVRSSYLGYAHQQHQLLVRHGRLGNGMDKRLPKHARHLVRLLRAGYLFYTEGRLEIKVPDPAELNEVADRVTTDLDFGSRLLALYNEKFEAATSPLRDKPDHPQINDFLLRMRKDHW